MILTNDLVKLMITAYERTKDYPLIHRAFSSEEVSLETWNMKGELFGSPLEVFKISVFQDSIIVCGILSYVKVHDEMIKMDVMTFSRSTGKPKFDYLRKSYHRPKFFIHINDYAACKHPLEYRNLIDLDKYAPLNGVEGGWKRVLGLITPFIMR